MIYFYYLIWADFIIFCFFDVYKKLKKSIVHMVFEDVGEIERGYRI